MPADIKNSLALDGGFTENLGAFDLSAAVAGGSRTGPASGVGSR